MKHHGAPWSKTLKLVSAAVTVSCLAMSVGFLMSDTLTLRWAAAVPLLILVGSAPFSIRGYTVTGDAILVHRLFWKTRVPLDGLQSVRSEPDAMRWSLRLCGNGGLFSFSGWFRNKALGTYRAWVTDPCRTVVLRYASKTLVMSPLEPEVFVEEFERGKLNVVEG